MFSPRIPQDVIADLGDEFLKACALAVIRARADWEEFRGGHPQWVADLYERESAGLIHSRIRRYLQDGLEGLPGFTVVAKEPHFEVSTTLPAGQSYRLRVKRHDGNDLISSYPTASDIQFWGVFPLDGLEEARLALGYRWDAETLMMGETIISYREGKANPIWAYVIELGDSDGVTGIRYTPIEPQLPTLDIHRDDEADDAGEAAR
jgi:hypothetical protein